MVPLISSVGFLASDLLGWEQGQRGKKRLLSISDVGDGSSPEIDPYALNQQCRVAFFSLIFFSILLATNHQLASDTEYFFKAHLNSHTDK